MWHERFFMKCPACHEISFAGCSIIGRKKMGAPEFFRVFDKKVRANLTGEAVAF